MKIEAAKRLKAAEDPQDVISMDVPLLMRLLELSRESLKTDEQLHIVIDRVIAESKKSDVITMSNYPEIWDEPTY